MKYTEQKIASFQDEFHRWQLIKMTDESNKKTINEITNTVGALIKVYENGNNNVCHYQIRKDRKVICNIKWERDAKHKFANMISDELNQLNIFR